MFPLTVRAIRADGNIRSPLDTHGRMTRARVAVLALVAIACRPDRVLLVEGHETVACTSRKVFKSAEDANDQPTCDLLTQRMQVHETTAGMLRSLLE